jgi:hypothetical protein
VLQAAIRSAQGYEGTDEYQPNGADRSELPGIPDPTIRADDASPTPAQLVEPLDSKGDTRIRVSQWSAEQKSFTAEAVTPVTLAVKLLSYPAWRVQVDGGEVGFDVQPVTARMLLPLDVGTHRVEIRFRRTWDRTAGDAISVLSCVALLGFAYGGHARRRRIVRTAASI